jgi:hypothetical protein
MPLGESEQDAVAVQKSEKISKPFMTTIYAVASFIVAPA